MYDEGIKSVTGKYSISSTINDIHILKAGPKNDKIVVVGFDEIHLCDLSSLAMQQVIKASPNVWECLAIHQSQNSCIFGYRDATPSIVKVMFLYMKKCNPEDTEIRPFKDNRSVSFMNFSGNVRLI